MTRKNSLFINTIIVTVLLTSLACIVSTGSGDTGTTGGTTQIRQWASTANASSEFGTTDWSASQATGAPDTTECSDVSTAWASSSWEGVDWLDAGFSTAVVPTQINIYETFTPGSVVKVEVRDTDGSFHTVYEGTPAAVAQCPRVMTINISNIDYKVNAVMISLDQTVLANWDEIDAVELVGTP